MRFKFQIVLITLLVSCTVSAENRAIKDTNLQFSVYQMDFSSDLSLTTGDDITGLSGTLRLPLSRYLGLGMTIAKEDIETDSFYYDFNTFNYTDFSYTADSMMLDVSLILRDYDFGSVNFSYSRDRQEITTISDPAIESFLPISIGRISTITTKYLEGEYYFDNSTLSIAQLRQGRNSETNILGGSWYSTENLRFEFAILDGGYNFYSRDARLIGVRYMPSTLSNTSTIGLTYTRFNDLNIDSILLSFTYYYGDRVSLLARDRKY